MTDPIFTPPPPVTTVAFLLILLAVQGGLLFVVRRAAPDPDTGARWVRRVALGFVVVMGVSGLAAGSGLMAKQTMPLPTMIYFMLCNGTAVLLALTAPGRRMSVAMPAAFWLLFQSFRLPLEVILHLWQEAGTIPVQMSWSGQNLDVISGVVGLVLGGLWWRRPEARWLGWVGHAVGLVLLVNVGRIALLSIPSPFRAFDGPPLLLPFEVPFLWIVPFAVSAAFFTHIVGIRALLAARS